MYEIIYCLIEDVEAERDILINFENSNFKEIALIIRKFLLDNDYAAMNPSSPRQTFKKMKECPECGHMKIKEDFIWTYDRYRIPFKKVCEDCFPKVQRKISRWKFDPSTGEHLEEDE